MSVSFNLQTMAASFINTAELNFSSTMSSACHGQYAASYCEEPSNADQWRFLSPTSMLTRHTYQPISPSAIIPINTPEYKQQIPFNNDFEWFFNMPLFNVYGHVNVASLTSFLHYLVLRHPLSVEVASLRNCALASPDSLPSIFFRPFFAFIQHMTTPSAYSGLQDSSLQFQEYIFKNILSKFPSGCTEATKLVFAVQNLLNISCELQHVYHLRTTETLVFCSQLLDRIKNNCCDPSTISGFEFLMNIVQQLIDSHQAHLWHTYNYYYYQYLAYFSNIFSCNSHAVYSPTCADADWKPTAQSQQNTDNSNSYLPSACTVCQEATSPATLPKSDLSNHESKNVNLPNELTVSQTSDSLSNMDYPPGDRDNPPLLAPIPIRPVDPFLVERLEKIVQLRELEKPK